MESHMNVKQGIIVNIKTMNYMPAKKVSIYPLSILTTSAISATPQSQEQNTNQNEAFCFERPAKVRRKRLFQSGLRLKMAFLEVGQPAESETATCWTIYGFVRNLRVCPWSLP